jgi:hypothetical protein
MQIRLDRQWTPGELDREREYMSKWGKAMADLDGPLEKVHQLAQTAILAAIQELNSTIPEMEGVGGKGKDGQPAMAVIAYAPVVKTLIEWAVRLAVAAGFTPTAFVAALNVSFERHWRQSAKDFKDLVIDGDKGS